MKKTTILIATLLLFGFYGAVNAYIVQPGDTLWKIAQKSNLSLDQIKALNPQISNFSLIYPGQNINTNNKVTPFTNIINNKFFEKLNLMLQNSGMLGTDSSFHPVQVQDTYLSGSGVSSSATTITLKSFKYPDNSTTVVMGDFGDIGYATLEPNTSREENISFTGITQNANGSATLTGVTRGLQLDYPYTTSASLKFSHAGSTICRFSNSTAFYSEIPFKRNAETIANIWTFASSSDSTVQRIQFGTSTMAYIKNDGGILYYCNNGLACSVIGAGANTYSFIRPLVNPSGSEVKLATSTYDFAFRDNLLALATSTVGSGTASGKALDDLFNARWNATTTKPGNFTFSDDLTITGSLTTSGIISSTGFTKSFTCGETIPANKSVYTSATSSRIFLADNDLTVTSTVMYVGMTRGACTEGTTASVQFNGIYSSTTATFATSTIYYVGDNGEITSTLGDNEYEGVIGKAIDGQTIRMNEGRYDMKIASTTPANSQCSSVGAGCTITPITFDPPFGTKKIFCSINESSTTGFGSSYGGILLTKVGDNMPFAGNFVAANSQCTGAITWTNNDLVTVTASVGHPGSCSVDVKCWEYY